MSHLPLRDRVRQVVPDALDGTEAGQPPNQKATKIHDALLGLAAEARSVKIEILIGSVRGGKLTLTPLTRPPPTFAGLKRVQTWAGQLQTRSGRTLPQIGSDLEQRLSNVPSFRWYRSVSRAEWSGRVGGWEVVTLADSGGGLRATKSLGQVNGVAGGLSGMSVRAAAREIQKFATLRGSIGPRPARKKEHLLGAAVLRDAVDVRPSCLPQKLRSVFPAEIPPLEFPALWAADGSARFIDAILRDGAVPWVGELKVSTSGQGQSYRHGITQAVLYRRFLRLATPLHSWFQALRPAVDVSAWRALVAFPKLQSPRAATLLTRLVNVADVFGVDIVELDDWETLEIRAME